MMTQPIRGVILDLDGTLIDSMQIWHEIDIAFFRENGLELPEGLSEQVAKMSIGEWAEFFVRDYVPTLTPPQVIARIEEMAADYYQHKIPMKPHVKEFLRSLDLHGIPYGVCTATYRSSAEAVLKRLDLYNRMQFVLTGEDFPCGKNTPDMYLAAQKLLGIPKEQILIVEDALHCIEMAVRCGFPVAAVYDPSLSEREYTQTINLSDIHARDLWQILRYIPFDEESIHNYT